MADERFAGGAEAAARNLARMGISYTGLGDSAAAVGTVAPIVTVAAVVMGIVMSIRSIAVA